MTTTTANNEILLRYELKDEDGQEPSGVDGVAVAVSRAISPNEVIKTLTPTESGGVYQFSSLDIASTQGPGLYFVWWRASIDGQVVRDEKRVTLWIKPSPA